MTDTFKEEVMSFFQDLYKEGYFRRVIVRFSDDDTGFLSADAYIIMENNTTWNMPITEDEDLSPVILAGEEMTLPLNRESLFLCLWHEAMERLEVTK